eukprot:gene4535-7912_t
MEEEISYIHFLMKNGLEFTQSVKKLKNSIASHYGYSKKLALLFQRILVKKIFEKVNLLDEIKVGILLNFIKEKEIFDAQIFYFIIQILKMNFSENLKKQAMNILVTVFYQHSIITNDLVEEKTIDINSFSWKKLQNDSSLIQNLTLINQTLNSKECPIDSLKISKEITKILLSTVTSSKKNMSTFELQTFQISTSILSKVDILMDLKLLRLLTSKLEFLVDDRYKDIGISLLNLIKKYNFQYDSKQSFQNTNQILDNIFKFLDSIESYISFDKVVILLISMIHFSLKKPIFNEFLKVENEDFIQSNFPEFFQNNLKVIDLLYKIFKMYQWNEKETKYFEIFNLIFSISIYWICNENHEILSNVILDDIKLGLIAEFLSYETNSTTIKYAKISLSKIQDVMLKKELKYIKNESKLLSKYENANISLSILMNPKISLKFMNESNELYPLMNLLLNEKIW